MLRILITTSTLPTRSDDPVPSFVKDQAVWLNKKHPEMKIDILAPHNPYSGTKRYIQHEHYDEYRFHYFWPFRYEKLTGRGIMPALKKNKLLYVQIPFLGLFQFFALLKLARKNKPDLIYAHWFTPQGITAALVAKLTGTPLIFTSHASDVSVLAKIPGAKKLVHMVCGQASAFTAVSERTATKLKSFFSKPEWEKQKSKFFIIPMGVDIDLPKVTQSDIKLVEKKYKIPSNKKCVLFIGRLAEKKGVRYLLDAWSLLPSDISSSSHLIIAGDGQLSEQLQSQAKKLKLGNITFTGYVHGADKDALLKMADYVCLPSIIDSSGDSEGFPVVLMEGLAAGKVILSSNTTGGETIIKDGEDGYIFPEKSAVLLNEALLKALGLDSNATKVIGSNAKRLAKDYSWDKIANEHYEIIDRITSENTANK